MITPTVKKIAALFVMVALIWIGIAWADDAAPSFQEKEGTPIIKNHGHFPWLWVAAGAIAVGIIVYLLVKKTPEYKLTVESDASVTGSPAAGTTVYKKGQSASYSFSAQSGFSSLNVLLDGVEVKSSGTFKMYRDHVLKVSALPITYTLTVNLGAGVTGTPPSGTSTRAFHESVPYSYAAADGYQNLKVLLNGVEAPAQGTLLMDRDHTLAVSAEQTPLPPSLISITGYWHLDLTPDSGWPTAPFTRTIDIQKETSLYRIIWTDLGPWNGIGFGEFWGNTFHFDGPYEKKDQFDTWYKIECDGILSGNDFMSGTYKVYHPTESGYVGALGTGTFNAHRL